MLWSIWCKLPNAIKVSIICTTNRTIKLAYRIREQA